MRSGWQRNGSQKPILWKCCYLTKPTLGGQNLGETSAGESPKIAAPYRSLIDSGFIPPDCKNRQVYLCHTWVGRNKQSCHAHNLVESPSIKIKSSFLPVSWYEAAACSSPTSRNCLDYEPINGLWSTYIGIRLMGAFMMETILISVIFFSDLLADDIEIIDHGALLKAWLNWKEKGKHIIRFIW